MEKSCETNIKIEQIQFGLTGLFICQYNQTKSNALQFNHPNQTLSTSQIINYQQTFNDKSSTANARDSVYIFVNDIDNLIVPYESVTDFQFLAVFQSHPATIPCKPTISTTKVTLWKTHTKNNVATEIRPNATLGISFDPEKGFYFESPRWDSDTQILECRFEYGGKVSPVMITVHWSSKLSTFFLFFLHVLIFVFFVVNFKVLPEDLHPLIDDSGARNVFHNTTFTLKCFVHIEIGVIIVIDWDIPNNNNNETVIFCILNSRHNF